ncbi:phage tail sheath family protein [Leuconostocaceae bacterium ESL0958]|nr:phage tail sheath family protein [Leuconostocaceae bacterium ESL0958]
MAGGNFSAQNKVLPGAYVNVKSMPSAISTSAGERGTVFTVLTDVGWGAEGLSTVTAGTDFFKKYGADLNSPKLLGLNMILRNAKKALVYNINDGSPARGTFDNLPATAVAKYPGVAGNDITVTISPDSGLTATFTIETVMGTKVVDKQSSIYSFDDFNENPYITFQTQPGKNGRVELLKLPEPVSVKLSGATQISSGTGMYGVQSAIEKSDFNTMVAADAADDSPLHRLFAEAAVRLRNEEGKKVQAVIPMREDTPDDEGIIVVGNSLILNNGTTLTESQAAGYVAGATAAALPNESLTYRQINGVKDVTPYTMGDERAIQEGVFVFTKSRDKVKVLQDINSLHTFTDTHGRDFSKNRPLRVLDDIANTIRITWEDSFVGKVTNNASGRDLFKASVVAYLTTLTNMNAIEAFKVDDINVRSGDNKDSVVVDLLVQPTDAMEKLYLSVTSK